MKMTKLRSLLALLMALAMLLSALPALAEDRSDPVQFTVSASFYPQERYASIIVSVSGDFQAHSLTAKLRYDSRYFSVYSLQKLEALNECPSGAITVLNESAPGEISFGYVCTTEPISKNGRMFSALFTVSEDCTEDQLFELEVDVFSYYPVGGEEEPIEYSVKNGVLQVSGSEPTETPEPTAEPTPEPTPEPEGLVVGWFFEEPAELDEWELIDSDGDGYNWEWTGEGNEVIEGGGSACSASWYDFTVLYPDNWAVSPYIEMPHGMDSLEFEVKGADPYYFREHFAVYAGEGDIYSMDEVLPETVAENQPCTVRIDLTRYADRCIRIAIRHFNTADEYKLVVDCVQILTQPAAFITYVGALNEVASVPLGSDAELPVFEDGEGLHYSFTVDGEPWDGKNVTGDVTVTVAYEIDTCTVTFVDPISGDVLGVEEVEYNGSVTPPEAPWHEHYTFAGWDHDIECICGDTVIYAVYDAEPVNVIFTDGFGNVIAEYHVGWGTACPEPDAPVAEGYTFIGWDADFSCITDDITVNAVWLKNYTVSFYDGMGGFIASFEVPEGEASPEPEIPEFEGWTFTGWDKDISCVTGDMAVSALWERNYYIVTFTGFISEEVIVEHGKDCPLPECELEGYHYVFKVDGEPWDGSYVTCDLTVRVTLTVNTYTVMFLDWDGSLLNMQRVNYLRPAKAPQDPVREGWVFVGWDGDFSCITEDTVVIAAYHLPEFTLTVHYVFEDGGEAAPEFFGIFGFMEEYEVPSPEIEGYTPDIPVVSGRFERDDAEFTVTYVKDKPHADYGDVDCNGVVDMSDISMLFSYLNGGSVQLSEQGVLNADANGDGGVNVMDITAIFNIIANS